MVGTFSVAFAINPSHDDPSFNVDIGFFELDPKNRTITLILNNTGENPDEGRFQLIISDGWKSRHQTLVNIPITLEKGEVTKPMQFAYSPSHFDEYSIPIQVSVKTTVESIRGFHEYDQRQIFLNPMSWLVPINHHVDNENGTMNLILDDVDKIPKKGFLIIDHENIDKYCKTLTIHTNFTTIELDVFKNQDIIATNDISEISNISCMPLENINTLNHVLPLAYADGDIKLYLEENIEIFFESQENNRLCNGENKCIILKKPSGENIEDVVDKNSELPTENGSYETFLDNNLFIILAVIIPSVFISYLLWARIPRKGKIRHYIIKGVY